jgi:hypothetical protein
LKADFIAIQIAWQGKFKPMDAEKQAFITSDSGGNLDF